MKSFKNLVKTKQKQNCIGCTVHFFERGRSCQKKFEAPNEEELLTRVFMFYIERYPVHRTQISTVQYLGKTLFWDEFTAHKTFAKGKLSYQEFKEYCLVHPERRAS